MQKNGDTLLNRLFHVENGVKAKQIEHPYVSWLTRRQVAR